MISDICQMFGCTPSEAMQQDPYLLDRIIEYRVAVEAKKAINEKRTTQLGKDVNEFMKEMLRAWKEANG